MNSDTEQIIRIWPYSQVPEGLKQLFAKPSEWVALIPPTLAWSEIEALFMRSHADGCPVTRHTLADGSVLFSGGNSEP